MNDGPGDKGAPGGGALSPPRDWRWGVLHARRLGIGATSATTTTNRRRGWIKSAIAGLALIGVLVTSRHLIVPALASLRHPRWLWLPVALLAELISMGSFAWMQRLTLARGGITIPLTDAASIAFASNALSVTVPVAGSTASVAFTAQQYAQRGASGALITWTLSVNGLIAAATFAVIIGSGGLMSGNPAAAIAGAMVAAIGLIPFLVLFAALRTTPSRAMLARIFATVLVTSKRIVRRPGGIPRVVAHDIVEALTAFRLDRRLSMAITSLALLNWLADIGCLASAVAFVGQPVPWRSLTLVYAAAIGAATIGLTPAGIGVVESAIAAALTAIGLPATTALPAAIVYRAISCWLVLAIGWPILAHSRRRAAKSTAV